MPSLPGRIDVYGAWPGLYDAILEMTVAVHRSGLERRTIELVNVRASQLNGCSHCLDRHTRVAMAAGWDPRHLAVVGAWRDAVWFTPQERAALALTESTVGSAPIDEHVVEEARAQFGDDGLAKLLLAIVAITAWNRVNVAAGIEPTD
jgi:AhpD family alkylhydroperoxidase